MQLGQPVTCLPCRPAPSRARPHAVAISACATWGIARPTPPHQSLGNSSEISRCRPAGTSSLPADAGPGCVNSAVTSAGLVPTTTASKVAPDSSRNCTGVPGAARPRRRAPRSPTCLARPRAGRRCVRSSSCGRHRPRGQQDSQHDEPDVDPSRLPDQLARRAPSTCGRASARERPPHNEPRRHRSHDPFATNIVALAFGGVPDQQLRASVQVLRA